jgi:hypothetical protein
MLQTLKEHIRNCLDHAADAGQRAGSSSSLQRKADFQWLQNNWASLAQSYDYSGRLERFLQEHGHMIAWGWEPSASAPFGIEVQIAVIEHKSEVHPLVFPCRRVLTGWVNAKTNQPLDVNPTHWREWTDD